MAQYKYKIIYVYIYIYTRLCIIYIYIYLMSWKFKDVLLPPIEVYIYIIYMCVFPHDLVDAAF